MSIARMVYVRCDRCGNPAAMSEDAKEARLAGRVEGFRRINGEDVCRFCLKAPDEMATPEPRRKTEAENR